MNGALIQGSDVAEKGAVADSADVVIIGSGAAGATAARVLTEAGLDVVVLEEGPHVPTGELRSDMYTTFKRVWRDMGFQVAEGRGFTPILQGSCVGGTTAVNGAIIHRLPKAIFDVWCAEHGAGDVLRYDVLERVWNQLDEELSVGPAPDAVFGNNNFLMERAVEKLGIRGNRIRRNVKDCQGSAHCNQGCPTARRQSMNNSYVPRAIAKGARVYADCRAEKLLVEGGRAVGVLGRFVRGKRGGSPTLMTVRARKAVILAASAIQTPLFLLHNGIGRASGLVGRRLQAHPGTGVVGVFDEPVKLWSGATQGFETTHYWNERMKFETVSMPLEFGAARLPGVGPALMERLANYGHLAIWGVQIRARAHGRVRRGFFQSKVIEYDMTNEDIRDLKLGVKRLVEMMFAAGAREVMPGVHGLPERISSVDEVEKIFSLPDDPRHFHCIAAHLFGTAVLGKDPRGSVVGPDCEAHDVKGLFIADSSVFPTNMGVNPQHSISAIAWLVAERIAD
ncbi:MAG TPA: GMC family oxidoreductase, partial [Polyangiaceae bacterium]|nr:GMC family oxidoreductase [Polyangiaceae bacterium]